MNSTDLASRFHRSQGDDPDHDVSPGAGGGREGGCQGEGGADLQLLGRQQ